MTESRPPNGVGSSTRIGTWWRDRGAAAALVIGGLLMALFFVPFTITHGPTSFNEERTLLGLDMHSWGLFLGVAPNVAIAAGFWTLRRRVAGSSRIAVGTPSRASGLSAIEAAWPWSEKVQPSSTPSTPTWRPFHG